VSIWAALAGGFAGTLVLTTVLRAAAEVGLTRMDLPFLLGTMVTPDRRRAKSIGYCAHFGLGLVFALGYFALFEAIGRSGWLLGAIFGAGHGIFSATALVNVLLPAVHPRMGHDFSTAGDSPLLEPPGFLMRNYGPSTAIVAFVAHVGYGLVIGGFVLLASP